MCSSSTSKNLTPKSEFHGNRVLYYINFNASQIDFIYMDTDILYREMDIRKNKQKVGVRFGVL